MNGFVREQRKRWERKAAKQAWDNEVNKLMSHPARVVTRFNQMIFFIQYKKCGLYIDKFVQK